MSSPNKPEELLQDHKCFSWAKVDFQAFTTFVNDVATSFQQIPQARELTWLHQD